MEKWANDLADFMQKDQLMKTCLISLVITTLWDHYLPTRIAEMKSGNIY